VDLDSIDARERITRHDVKARIDEFSALAGFEHAHKGMTSRDLTENVEQLQVRAGLELVRDRAVATLVALARLAAEYSDTVIVGRSHNVAAQATTLGKRFANYGEELLQAVVRVDELIARYPLRGLKGPVGTQQDLLDLLDGDTAKLEAVISAGRGDRYGVALRLQSADASSASHTDVSALGQAVVQVGFVPPVRGRHPLPTLRVQTQFPLGLFRAWAVWHPAMSVVVYPQPERPATALPTVRGVPGGPLRSRTAGADEFDGVRPYRRGDAPKAIAWKQAAKTLASGGDLISRDHSAHTREQLWLSWHEPGWPVLLL
jgi:hypothetical protein